MGYSWDFWIRSPCCIVSMCWDLLDALRVERRKRRSLYSLWGSFYALQFQHHVFTACNPKPHQSRASRGKGSGARWDQAAEAAMQPGVGKGGHCDGMFLVGRNSQPERPPQHICIAVLLLGVQPGPAQGSSAASQTLHLAVLKREQGVPAWRRVTERL